MNVENPDFARVEAIHPHWRGFLRLSKEDNSVVHESHLSKGTYSLSNGRLTVSWERFSPDVFVEQSGIYVHQQLLTENPGLMTGRPGLETLSAVTVGGKPLIARGISVSVPDEDYDVTLRLGTSDVPVFSQVFVRNEYASSNLPGTANAIVDLGANIGLTTVFFALRYPEARILSVEPADDNYFAMVTNTNALGTRVQRKHAAVWVRDGSVNLRTETEDGSSLGAWGVQVSDRPNREGKLAHCYKLTTLMDDAGFCAVDILKVDIEGAELEIFSCGAAGWLERTSLIIVETHDRFRLGSDEAVRKAVNPMFEELPPSGENLFFRRRPG